MSEDALAAVEELWAALAVEDVVAALNDPETDRQVRATLARFAEADFEVRMRAPGGVGGTELVDRGPDGFRRNWREWVEPFATFRVELERRLEAGDAVIDLVRLSGTTKTGGVTIEQDGAALWSFEDGKLTSVVFYLEPGEALEAAGIDPGRLSQE
jgi:ketosteroid isomerase-like protein